MPFQVGRRQRVFVSPEVQLIQHTANLHCLESRVVSHGMVDESEIVAQGLAQSLADFDIQPVMAVAIRRYGRRIELERAEPGGFHLQGDFHVGVGCFGGDVLRTGICRNAILLGAD